MEITKIGFWYKFFRGYNNPCVLSLIKTIKILRGHKVRIYFK